MVENGRRDADSSVQQTVAALREVATFKEEELAAKVLSINSLLGSCSFISQEVVIKSFCRSQLPCKSVTLSFT